QITVNDASDVGPDMVCPADFTVYLTDPASCMTTVYFESATASDACNSVGFAGSFDPLVWTESSVGDGTDGEVDTADAPDAISLTGTTDGTAGTNTDWMYCMTVVSDGTLSFDWEAEAIGGGAQLINDEPAYSIDGAQTILATGSDSNASGSEEIALTAGQEFCFIVRSNNQFATTTFDISNLEYNQVTITQLAGPLSDSVEGAEDGEAIPAGTHTVTFQAEDGNGNTSTCSFEITVLDTIRPVFTFCPTIDPIQLGANECEVVVLFDAPEAEDNCELDQIIQVDVTGLSSGDLFPIGTHVLSFMASDIYGNTSICNVEITVLEYPVDGIVCNKDINLSLDYLTCDGSLNTEMTLLGDYYGCPDNCEFTITNDHGVIVPNYFTVDDVGRTFDYMVCCQGNCCWGKVFIQDEVAPTILCEDVEISCLTDINDAPQPTVMDNCGAELVLVDQVYENLSCGDYTGKYIRYWKAVDAFGNESDICEQTVNLLRGDVNLAFIPNTSGLNTVSCSVVGFDEEVPVNLFGVPSYNGIPLYPFTQGVICNGYVDYSDKVVAQTPCQKIIERTWEIGEWWCGTTVRKTAVQVIRIADTEGPSITGLSDMNVSTGNYSCTAHVLLPTATVVDACADIKAVYVNWDGGSLSTNGGYADIPVGVQTVTYTAVDQCDNISKKSIVVTVRDQTDPITICDQFTTLAILPDGTTHLTAEDVDDGSFDECGPVTLDIRRMDDPCGNSGTEWSDKVYFCCADIGNTVMVVLRATDLGGNSNMCMVTVEVQDKVPSYMVCPANQTVDCGFTYDPNNLSSYFGEPTLTGGGCTDLSNVAEQATYNITSCGTGTITRHFTLTQPITGPQECYQVITFSNPAPFDESGIIWPSNYVNNDGCSVSDISPENMPAPYAEPIISEGTCDQVGFTYEDKTYPTQSNGACFKVLRNWIVIDWCQKNTDGTFKTWEYEQEIKVNNLSGPQITSGTELRHVCSYDVNCGPAYIELTASADDDCTSAEDLTWFYSVHLEDGSTINGSGNDASDIYPIGVHSVDFVVGDNCGNTALTSYDFEVENCKAPVAYCMNGLSTQLIPSDPDPSTPGDETEEVTIQAEMFNNGSYQSCNTTLEFSFSSNVNDKTRTFGCNDIGRQFLEMWVTDSNGNTSYCETFIDVIDTNEVDICLPRLAHVAGRLATEGDDEIPNALVSLNQSGLEPILTNSEGEYQFDDMQMGGNYVVNPEKDGDDANGVSTLDLVLIQRHILGLATLSSPYKIIAADVNHDDKITASDLIQIRKLILGLTPQYPDNTSWRFVNKDMTFFDETNPFTTPLEEKYYIEDFQENMNVNFIGIKIGDVNESMIMEGARANVDQARNQGQISFIAVTPISTNDVVEIPVYSIQFDEVYGFQMGMEMDGYEYVGIESAGINISNENVAFIDGTLRISWSNSNGISLDEDEAIFKLVLRKNFPNARLAISNQGITSELYKGEDLGTFNLNLEYNVLNDEKFEFMIGQNNPNPFKSVSNLEYSLPNDGEVMFKVFDLSGRTLMERNLKGNKGFNNLSINKNELNTTGVLYYQMTYNNQSVTKKMIIIE
ncbi:MAG TPA: HYR domain-containing protein, partial [Saprospiraceae bacterium]|nr:HYR domain-containing protein [Saprospiraceae bacterium]